LIFKGVVLLNLILGISLIILGIVSVFLKDYLSLSEYPFTKYILPGILLIIGFIQIFLYVDDYHEKQKEKALKTTSGTLSSIYILNPEEGKYPRLEIGNSGAIFAFATNSKNSVINTMESLFRLNSLKIFLENGLVKISAKFRNSNGNLVAELIKNEWIHKPLESDLIWDRNYSENALEVKDGKGRVQLLILYLNIQVLNIWESFLIIECKSTLNCLKYAREFKRVLFTRKNLIRARFFSSQKLLAAMRLNPLILSRPPQ
jgi:hypothetical protein